MPNAASRLTEITASVRDIHLRMLQSSVQTKKTAGSCFYAAFLLRETVARFGQVESVIIRGGDGGADGGYRDGSGAWHGHYWVEAAAEGCWFILDVTADQFGGPPVVVEPVETGWHQYHPGDQSITDAHALDMVRSFEGET